MFNSLYSNTISMAVNYTSLSWKSNKLEQRLMVLYYLCLFVTVDPRLAYSISAQRKGIKHVETNR